MNVSSFLKLVEIRTKIASVIPFSLGTLYAVYHFHAFNLKNFILLFIAMITFDMVTTTLNNYYDYKRANIKCGYNYESHNAIVKDHLKESAVIGVIVILLAVATLFGILLFLNTNSIILGIGALSFLIGICYSFGPVPISGTPFGEMLSGFFMGFVILFLAVFIHASGQSLVSLVIDHSVVAIRIDFVEVLYIFLMSIPTMFGIANIMLANNICDIEDDLQNRRYTLPNFIGKKNALWLFGSLYYFAFIAIIISSMVRILPMVYLFAVLVLIPVSKNIKLFYKNQTKKDTFALSVQNFILISGAQILLLAVSIVAFLK